MIEPRFSCLTPEQLPVAERWLALFLSRRKRAPSEHTRRALVSVAMRLARNPPTSSFGRLMLSRRGSKARRAMSRAGRLNEVLKPGRLEALLDEVLKR